MSTVVPVTQGELKLSPAARNLRSRIEAGTARIGVVGLGYVGLPLAMAFERGGFNVVGIDLEDNNMLVHELVAGPRATTADRVLGKL